ASFAVTSLLLLDIIKYSNAIYTWFTWWVGDSIGVMITVPLMLIAFSKPQTIWRERLRIIPLPLIIMSSIVISLFSWVSQWESERNQFEVKEIASDNVEKLRASFTSYVDAVVSIERFYMSSTQSNITREEFKTFVEYTLKNKSGINGLSWNPIISAEQRYGFELSVRLEGINKFEIKERSDQGKLIPAQQRKTYVPVHYIEPMKGNEKALGFNVASNRARQKTLNKSRDSAMALATPKITLVQDGGEQSGFLLFYPVYSGPAMSLESRRKNIKGFAVGVFRVGDITDAVLEQQVRKKVIVGIYDISGQEPANLYGPEKYEEYGVDLFKFMDNITVGGRTWKIVFWPSPDYLASHNTWQAWAALVSGLLFTSILGAFLLSMTGKSNYLNSEVKKRTLEIENKRLEILKTNNELEKRNKQLESSNQELDRFAFVASHDLKSPLQAIEQLSCWIEEDCQELLPAASREHLGLLKQRIERMKNLLADLLLFSRVSRDDFQYESVNLQSLIEKAISFNYIPDTFTIEVENCNTNLILSTTPIELAIRNLISNAVKHHNKTTGTIIIEYTKIDGEHSISISDDGPGIAQHLQQYAIEMFHTLQSRDEMEGSGLGLSIVNKAMERINGHLKIISDGKKGTRVELRWPVQENVNIKELSI
ncbi:MAG: CHASE domain-containing protein, partial [Colwellia sp.]